MNTILFAAISVLFCLAAIHPATAKPPTADSLYASMVERIKAGDTTVDYQVLRYTYAKSSLYDGLYPPAEEEQMNDALHKKDYPGVIAEAEKILARCYVHIQAHSACARAYRALKDPTRSAFHQSVAERLLNSIEKSGDGTSVGTGYKIISTPERYALLLSRGEWPIEQEYIDDPEKPCERVIAEHEATGRASTYYFDISVQINWILQKEMEREEAQKKAKKKR